MTDQPHIPSEVEVSGESVHSVVVKTAEPNATKFVVWRRRPTYMIIGSLLAAIFLMFCAFTLLLRDSQDSINRLTEQLAEARDEIEQRADVVAKRDTCRLRYTAAITESQSQVLVAFSRAVGPIPEEERQPLIDTINRAGDALEQAIAARSLYETRGAPLPCPLD